MEMWLLSVLGLTAVIVLPILGGWVYGKVQQLRGADTEAQTMAGAMAAAQGARMDAEDRREEEEGK